MFIDKFNLSLLLVMLLSLGGCASKQTLKLVDPSRAPKLEELQHWQLDARVAIRTPDDSITASLEWQKNDDLFDFLISGPFGVTYAHLVQLEEKATLEIPDHDTFVHYDAKTLLQQALGWDFPIDSLAFWVKGIPSGNPAEIISYNQQGRIEKIQMNFWQIDFSKYQSYQGYNLPKMIKAKHPNMSLKVVAKKWSFYQ